MVGLKPKVRTYGARLNSTRRHHLIKCDRVSPPGDNRCRRDGTRSSSYAIYERAGVKKRRPSVSQQILASRNFKDADSRSHLTDAKLLPAMRFFRRRLRIELLPGNLECHCIREQCKDS